MNLTSATNTPHPGVDQHTEHPRLLRSASAPSAGGFAQIMRAFDPEPAEEPESGKADQTEDASEPVGETEESGTQESDQGEGSAEGAGKGEQRSDTEQPEDDESGPGEPKPTGDGSRADSGAQTAPAADHAVQAQAEEQATLRREAELRLLNNQSEQARLSIKGLVRSLTHSTGANLTTLAVETRLGTGEAVPKDAAQEPIKPEPPVDPPKQAADRPGMRAAGALSDTVPDSPRYPNDHPQREPLIRQEQPLPVQARPDQSGVELQNARSTRADAASQQAPAVPVSDSARHNQPQTAAQIAGATRADSSQSVRAVTGNESAQVGAGLKDATSGTLVEKMGRTAMPETQDRSSVLAQVQRGLASLMRSGKGDMTMKLTPGHLGEVRIRIKADGDRLSVRFETSTQEAGELLRHSAKELALNLRGKGMQLEHFSIEQRPENPNPLDNTDPRGEHSPGHEHSPSHHDGGDDGGGGARRDEWADGAMHTDEQPNGHEDDTDDDADAIWTELGLDAIA